MTIKTDDNVMVVGEVTIKEMVRFGIDHFAIPEPVKIPKPDSGYDFG